MQCEFYIYLKFLKCSKVNPYFRFVVSSSLVVCSNMEPKLDNFPTFNKIYYLNENFPLVFGFIS